jgi:general secretion pathway protein N
MGRSPLDCLQDETGILLMKHKTFGLLRSASSATPSLRRAGSARQAAWVAGPKIGVWAWLGALAGALLAAIIFAPAALLAYSVLSLSNGRVLLSQAQGSVWEGRAQLLLAGGQGTQDVAALPGVVQWRMRPQLSGLGIQLHLTCCSDQPMQVQMRPGWKQAQAQVGPVNLNLPAQWLSGLGAPFNTLALQGHMHLRSEGFKLQWAGNTSFDGQATMDLMAMSSSLSTLRPLGDYRVKMIGGAAPTMDLETLQGALQLTGKGQWQGSRMRFSGEAVAAPERQEALANVLNIIGRRQGAKSLISLG